MFKFSRATTRLSSLAATTCIIALACGMPARAQELRCGTGTIRLVCDHRSPQGSRCDASHAEFIQPDGATTLVRTPKGLDDVIIPQEIQCYSGDGGFYVEILFAACFDCGNSMYIDLFTENGVAITRKSKKFDITVSRKHIVPIKGSPSLELK